MESAKLQQLMQLSQQMRTRVAALHERLRQETHTAASGGGMVQVTVDGRGSIKGISIDPTVIDPKEVEMLEDLIVVGVSEAQRRARKEMENEMRQAAGGLPLPSLGGLLG